MKGIMFSPHLVRELLKTKPGLEVDTCSLLAPYKIETRRLLPRQPKFGNSNFSWEYYPGRVLVSNSYDQILQAIALKSRYKVGDMVYIKETSIVDQAGEFIGFAADYYSDEVIRDMGCKKKSAMFLPEQRARMTICILGVDVVRVCDITSAQALAEGFSSKADFWKAFSKINGIPDYSNLISIFRTVAETNPLTYYCQVNKFLEKDYGSNPGHDYVFIRAGELCYAYKFMRIT